MLQGSVLIGYLLYNNKQLFKKIKESVNKDLNQKNLNNKINIPIIVVGNKYDKFN